jgi:hypothetical protein
MWSEEQNILQHMHEKEFWILTNKCEISLIKHKNEAEGPRGVMAPSLVFVFKFISTFNSRNPKLFFMHVLKKDVLLL